MLLSTIYDAVKPDTLHYSELKYPQEDSSLYRYLRKDIQGIRERNNLTPDLRIPFTAHLQGIDEAQFN